MIWETNSYPAKNTRNFMKEVNAFMRANLLSVLGIAATIVGGAATLLGNWVSDKKNEEMIEEKVNEALAKRENEEEEAE